MPFCHSTSGIKALKKLHSTDSNQWPGLILSSSTAVLPKKGHWSLYAISLPPVPCVFDRFVNANTSCSGKK